MVVSVVVVLLLLLVVLMLWQRGGVCDHSAEAGWFGEEVANYSGHVILNRRSRTRSKLEGREGRGCGSLIRKD